MTCGKNVYCNDSVQNFRYTSIQRAVLYCQLLYNDDRFFAFRKMVDECRVVTFRNKFDCGKETN